MIISMVIAVSILTMDNFQITLHKDPTKLLKRGSA